MCRLLKIVAILCVVGSIGSNAAEVHVGDSMYVIEAATKVAHLVVEQIVEHPLEIPADGRTPFVAMLVGEYMIGGYPLLSLEDCRLRDAATFVRVMRAIAAGSWLWSNDTRETSLFFFDQLLSLLRIHLNDPDKLQEFGYYLCIDQDLEYLFRAFDGRLKRFGARIKRLRFDVRMEPRKLLRLAEELNGGERSPLWSG
jgi:hypothetical protein